MPVPRLSNRINLENEPIRLRLDANDGTVQRSSMCDMKPGTKTTSYGPWPTTW
jgi:hypothetical protein